MKRTKLLRKTPLKRQSAKRKAESRIYSRLRKEFLEDHPRCQWPTCVNRSEDVHHKEKRGRNYLKTETWAAVCRRCHDWIHQNGKLARKLNWLR